MWALSSLRKQNGDCLLKNNRTLCRSEMPSTWSTTSATRTRRRRVRRMWISPETCGTTPRRIGSADCSPGPPADTSTSMSSPTDLPLLLKKGEQHPNTQVSEMSLTVFLQQLHSEFAHLLFTFLTGGHQHRPQCQHFR